MSLANLIKNLHKAESQGSPSLKASIEQYFLKRSHEFDEERFLDKQTRFHPSQISYWGVCPRAYYLAMKREELGLPLQRPKQFETSLLRIFEHGHSIHSLYQDKVLGPAGVLYGKWELGSEVVEGFQPSPEWKYVEPRLWWSEKRISGYCDGFLCLNDSWYLLEIKSASDQSFRWIKRSNEAKSYHVRQAQIYIQAPHDLEKKPEVEGAIILYINKDSGEELDFFVPTQRDLVEPIFSQIDLAIDALDQSIIPSRVDDCKSLRSKRAADCNVCNACFSLD